jgi:hypothetical protein
MYEDHDRAVNHDMLVKTGQPEQDSRNRTDRTRQPGQNRVEHSRMIHRQNVEVKYAYSKKRRWTKCRKKKRQMGENERQMKEKPTGT